MNQVFLNQSYLTLTLSTGIDLSTATVAKILYTKPGGEQGQWTANADGSNVEYEVQDGDIDVCGIWLFQAYAEIDGRKALGQITRTEVIPGLDA